jgi:hypothetical protein
VRLNGRPIDGPQVITLKTKQAESKASLEGECFSVPPAFLTEKAVDVIFTVPRNKIYLVAISPSFFTGPWDIDLEDKKFDQDVGLPKHARIREACAVVFHGGEPENALVQTGCRTPLPDTATKAGEPRHDKGATDPYRIKLVESLLAEPEGTSISFIEKWEPTLGDGAAVGILKAVPTEEQLLEPRRLASVLGIIRGAFSFPCAITLPEDKTPRVTVFVLQDLLRQAKDEDAKRKIGEAIAYVQQQAATKCTGK